MIDSVEIQILNPGLNDKKKKKNKEIQVFFH